MDNIIIILFIIAIMYYFILRDNLVKTTGSNNKTYYTRKNQADIAVEQLVKIDDFLLKLNKLLVKEHPNHILIQKKLKKSITLKELPDKSNYIAYTINKNNLYICLRDKSGSFENEYNRIYFVVMHELAHIITKSIGHTEEYWNNYKLILKTAIDNNLYEYKNYYKEPVEFCDKKITSTPYLIGGNTNTNNISKIIGVIILLLIGFYVYKTLNKKNNSISSQSNTGYEELPIAYNQDLLGLNRTFSGNLQNAFGERLWPPKIHNLSNLNLKNV